MDALGVLYAYLGLSAGLVAVLLFGEAPWAAGTPLPWLRWLVTAAWAEGLEWLVARLCGDAGLRMLDRAVTACCERSNPTLQFAYLAMWGVGYGLYWQHVFKLLPNAFASEVHLFTGTAAVCATLTTFVAASMSRPGRVTSSNVSAYLSAYPPGSAIFPHKACASCRLPRPARSKHCGACGGCIARFDHHCAWLNTCVGGANTRLFLLFLAANVATCGYGVALAAAALAGELQRRGLLDVYVYDPGLRARVPLYSRPARLLEWLIVFYPVQVALTAFLAVTGLLMAGFFMYQGILISEGVTTYERFKWDSLARQLREQAQQQQQGQRQRQQQQQQQQQQGAWAMRLWGRVRGGGGDDASAAPHKRVALPPNPYDRGLLANWSEVLWPEHFLAQHGALATQQQQHQHQHQQQEGPDAGGQGPVAAGAGDAPKKQR